MKIKESIKKILLFIVIIAAVATFGYANSNYISSSGTSNLQGTWNFTDIISGNLEIKNVVNYTSVELRKSDGSIIIFKETANTATARGQQILNAQGNATVGDTIFVQGNATLNTSLGKNGVNWYFYPGATVSYNGTRSMWMDTNGMSYNIGGYGNFISSFQGLDTSFNKAVFEITNTSSIIHVSANSIINNVTSSPNNAGVLTSGNGGTGTFFVTKGIYSVNYDAVLSVGTGGTLNIQTGEIIGGDDGIEWASGDLRVIANRIDKYPDAGGSGINQVGGNLTVITDELNGGIACDSSQQSNIQAAKFSGVVNDVCGGIVRTPSIMQMTPGTLPSCDSNNIGFGANATKSYYCNGSTWNALY